MSISGYSGIPLLNKLDIRPSMKVWLINKPADYYALLEMDISKQLVNRNETADFIHLFVKNNKEFETEMKLIKPVVKKNT